MRIHTESVLDVEGAFFSGDVPGTVCFVPTSMLSAGQLDRATYVAEGWASLNIHAQPPELRLGSHLFPDLKKPVTQSAAQETKTRLQRLRPQAVGA
jgi:hypothetical protein